jgi:predicted amidophosphoribosyltransferase
MLHQAFQTALRLVYPPRCVGCGAMVESDFGLCGPCWRDTPFITGLTCDLCGVPLPGEETGEAVHCDACSTTARPWGHGRAAMLYDDNGRKLVLALKHGDRHEVARPAALWLTRAARDVIRPDTLITPVPLHWGRFLQRRFNQSAVLAEAMARHAGLAYCPDLLRRHRATDTLKGKNHDARFHALQGAISPNPARATRAEGKPVLIVDDVMTSGATFAAATEAAYAAGATDVCVLALARVARDA